MKRAIKIIMVTGIFLLLTMVGFSQSPPHPNGGSGPGSGNTPVGGGAPIGGGLILMISMAAGYGMKKHFQANWKEK